MKFTPEQVAQMRKAAQDYAEAQSSDFQEIGEIAEERLCTLAAERALEAAASACEQTDEDGEGPDSWGWHAKDYAKAIRAMKEHQ